MRSYHGALQLEQPAYSFETGNKIPGLTVMMQELDPSNRSKYYADAQVCTGPTARGICIFPVHTSTAGNCTVHLPKPHSRGKYSLQAISASRSAPFKHRRNGGSQTAMYKHLGPIEH